jgi:hypothetical protein
MAVASHGAAAIRFTAYDGVAFAGRCGLFEVLNPTNPWSGVVVGFGFFDLFGFDEVALSQW